MTPTGVAPSPERLIEDRRAFLAEREAEDGGVVAGQRRLGRAENRFDGDEGAAGGAAAVVPPPPCTLSATTCTVPSSNGAGVSRGVPSLKCATRAPGSCAPSRIEPQLDLHHEEAAALHAAFATAGR